MGVMKPDLIMKSIIPVVMAGVLGIYGLIIAVIIANGGALHPPPSPLAPQAPRPSFAPRELFQLDASRAWRATARSLAFAPSFALPFLNLRHQV
jgi:hypothetical protein